MFSATPAGDLNADPNEVSSSVVTHQQKDSSSESPLVSFFLSMWDRIVSLALSLHIKEPIEDWKISTLVFIFNIYMLFSSLLLPTITMSNEIGSAPMATSFSENSTSIVNSSSVVSYYNWGFFGGWIFNILNLGTSLSFDRVPYVGVVVISFIFISLLLICSFLMVIAYRFMLHSDSMYGKTKIIVQFLLGIILVCALFMTFIMSSFLDCNYDFTGKKTHTLIRFGADYTCFNTNNIIFFVLNIVGNLILFLLLAMAMFVLSNTHPLSKGFFVAADAFMPTMFWLGTCIELFLVSLIPTQLGFIRSTIHLLAAFLLTYITFKKIPFYRHIENSILFGICCGKVGASLCSLVSSAVNTSNEWKLGIGLTVLTLCVIIILFIGGLTFFQIYQLLIMRKVRHELVEAVTETLNANSAEKEALLTYQNFEERKIVHYLEIYLHLSMRSKVITQDYSDVEIAVNFIRGITQNKSFSNVNIMITAATLISYHSGGDSNGILMGIKILASAMKNHPSFSQIIFIKRKGAEIETHADSDISRNKKNLLELRQVLEKLEKYHQDLNYLHKTFWKEMMSDAVNIEKIEEINRKMASNTAECEIMYENLMQSYGNERRLLRLYAYFLENFKFDKESSQTMLSEALTIEDEESKAKRRTQQKFKQNKIVPIKDMVKEPSYGSAHDLASQVDPFSKVESSSNLGFKQDTPSEMGLIDDMPLDGVENNVQAKKEFLFRSALSLPEPHLIQKIALLIFIGFSALLVVTSIALSVSLSIYATKDITNVKDSCSPLGGSSLLLSEIRTTQAHMNVLNASNSFFNDHKARLKSYTLQLQVLIDKEKTSSKSEYENYVSGTYEILIPSLPESGVSSTSPIYTSSTASSNILSISFASSFVILGFEEII